MDRTKKAQPRAPPRPTRPSFHPYLPKQPNQSLSAEYSDRDKSYVPLTIGNLSDKHEKALTKKEAKKKTINNTLEIIFKT